jgi:hypothetical protein
MVTVLQIVWRECLDHLLPPLSRTPFQTLTFDFVAKKAAELHVLGNKYVGQKEWMLAQKM